MSRLSRSLVAFALAFAALANMTPAVASEAAQASPAAALQPTEAEEKAYYDLSAAGMEASNQAQSTLFDEMLKPSPDADKLCRLAGEAHRLQAQAVKAQMAYLLELRGRFKAIDKLMDSWLGSSSLKDTFRIGELERCSEAEAKKRGLDDETALFLGRLEQELSVTEKARKDAVADGNVVAESGSVQTEAALLKEMVEMGEILRDYGEAGDKAAVARLPAWKARRKEVDALMDQKVFVYTDPDNKRNAPYVFVPFEEPPMPADDAEFEKVILGLVFHALDPMAAGLKAQLSGDTAGACTRLRQADSELARVKAFVTAYADKQKAAGKPSDAVARILPKIDEMIATNRRTIAITCTAA